MDVVSLASSSPRAESVSSVLSCSCQKILEVMLNGKGYSVAHGFRVINLVVRKSLDTLTTKTNGLTS
jgi:hypothetical protein